MAWQPSDPMFVTLAPGERQAETPATTVGDILLNSLGVAGVLLLASLVLGGLVALVLVRWHRQHPPEASHPPSVSPFTAGPGTPPR